MVLRGRRDEVIFLIVFFFKRLIGRRAFFFLRPFPREVLERLAVFGVFFLFIGFFRGMWGSSLRMVSFKSDRALSRSASTGVTCGMGALFFTGIM